MSGDTDEPREWHSIKIWKKTYRRFKLLAARQGKTLAQVVDEASWWETMSDAQKQGDEE